MRKLFLATLLLLSTAAAEPPPDKLSEVDMLRLRVIELERELAACHADAVGSSIAQRYQIADPKQLQPDGTIKRAPKPEARK